MATTDNGSNGDNGTPAGSNWAAARAAALGLGRWPDVVREIEAGRGFAAYARLRGIRKSSPADGERERIDAALAESRLFAEPLRSAPGLHRINGVGPTMIGGEQRDPSDGSYVKTRWLTFVFVPVMPLDAWLVSDAPGGGWHFHARVPVAGNARVVRTVALAALGAAAVAVGGWVIHRFTHSDMQVVNGLDAAAELVIDDDPPIAVGPGARVTVVASSGEHRLRCTVAGKLIDDRTERVSGTADLVVYNVAGAAPVFVEDVEYLAENAKSSARPGKGGGPAIESFAGQVFAQRETVQFVFKDAPAKISMGKSDNRVVRRHAGMIDGGWRSAVGLAHQLGGAAAAEKVILGVADAVADDPDAVREIFDAAMGVGGAEAATRVSERLVAQSPKSIPARRALQDARVWSGDLPRAAADLRAALAESPESPQLKALLARLAPASEGQALARSAMTAAPDDEIVQEMAFRVRYRTGDIEAAAADADRILAARNPRLAEVFPNCARALHAAGKPELALERLAVVVDDAAFRRSGMLTLATYERIRLAAGASIPARRSATEWIPRLVALQVDPNDTSAEAGSARDTVTAEVGAWLAAFARDADALPPLAALPAGAPSRRSAETTLAIWRDAGSAAQNMSGVTPDDVNGLESELLLQLGAELGRLGRTSEAAVVHAAMAPWARADFRDPTFVTLPEVEAYAELNYLPSTAALLLAWAAREPDAPRRAALVARARSLDICGDVHAW